MSGKSRQEVLSEYEKDYLKRVSKEREKQPDQYDEPLMSEEEREEKIKHAEKIQNESAAQVQASSAAKNQSEDEQKKKAEFTNELSKIQEELRLLKEMATLTEELESLKKQIKKPSKRKITKKKAVPKRKASKKKAVPKRK